ncbi:MAG: META domain-containing protein [Opitutaceae bacterium]|jgi:heat shock protein HslJ
MSFVSSIRILALSLLTVGGVLTFSGCSTATSPIEGQDSNRTLTMSGNTNWVLVRWVSADGKRTHIKSPAPTLQIGYAGRITGQSGVNTYAGTTQIVDGQLDWGSGFAATRMAGTPELTEMETRYLNDLKSTRTVTVSGNRLIFVGAKPLRIEFARDSR